MVPPRCAVGREPADLAAPHRQAAGVEGFAQRQRHRPVAVPARLGDDALHPRHREGGGQSVGMAAGVDDEIGVRPRRRRRPERDLQSLGDRGPRGVRIDEGELGPGQPPAEPGAEQPDHAPAHDDDAVADRGAGVPQHVHRRLHVGGQHRAARRHPGRHRRDGAPRNVVPVLVGIEAEDHLSIEVVRTLDDPADAAVAVLHGAREVPLLERRPHRLIL